MTRALLLEGSASVVAIERDERFREPLLEISQRSGGKLTLIFGDALKADYERIARDTGAGRVAANLPYNIGTPLIIRWLTGEHWPPWYDKLVVMLQQEVAERLVARPSGENYGRLSVIAQFRCRLRLLFELPARVFTPSPKVSSALVEISPLAGAPQEVSVAQLEKVTAAAFGQRRKMLRSSLAALGVDTPALLAAADIDPTSRAEQLTVDDFIRLARCLPLLGAK